LEFKDHFSKQAKEYALYRPKYPPELFEYLSGLAKEHKTAWDSATGNGQAALGLADHFDKVVATDASEAQISQAFPHQKIEYLVAPAESSGLESSSIDLITVASAIHWLDTEKFYSEAKRVLKPSGVISVWVYDGTYVNPEIDAIIFEHLSEKLDKHWPKESAISWNFEKEIQLPFEKIETPNFKIELQWSLDDYISFLYTWSSTQNYIKAHGVNPLDELRTKLLNIWGAEDEKRPVTMPLMIKAGRT
jgi:ubiquinone/menaquinone biosynthesis C-methylase UbiE